MLGKTNWPSRVDERDHSTMDALCGCHNNYVFRTRSLLPIRVLLTQGLSYRRHWGVSAPLVQSAQYVVEKNNVLVGAGKFRVHMGQAAYIIGLAKEGLYVWTNQSSS